MKTDETEIVKLLEYRHSYHQTLNISVNGMLNIHSGADQFSLKTLYFFGKISNHIKRKVQTII